jgi:hypothetical protein
LVLVVQSLRQRGQKLQRLNAQPAVSNVLPNPHNFPRGSYSNVMRYYCSWYVVG